jgi:hypothetical protein
MNGGREGGREGTQDCSQDRAGVKGKHLPGMVGLLN